MKSHETKKLAAVVTAALASSISASVVSANQNPFQIAPLKSGYMVAYDDEGQPSPDSSIKREGSIGDNKLGSGQCGEGTCGTNATSGEGELKGSKGDEKLADGKCGEGSCGTDNLKK